MSIEGGAKFGYVNPDQTTIEYLQGKDFVPRGEEFEERVKEWLSIRSDDNAVYDDIHKIDCATLAPMATWGTNPGHSESIDGVVPHPSQFPEEQQKSIADAQEYSDLKPGTKMSDIEIDFAYIGSCTNGRIEDLREAARYAKGTTLHPSIEEAIVVPGSMAVALQAEKEGLHEIFKDAGYQWRLSACSLCLGMNEDKIPYGKRAASSSNRNFEGRQGPGSRTSLVSPAMVIVSGIEGKLADPRKYERMEL